MASTQNKASFKTYLKMDNGMYWTSTPGGIKGQYERDQACVFEVCPLNNGKVEIKDYRGNNLRPPTSTGWFSNAIQVAPNRDEAMFQFELQHENEKVFFRAGNGLFLSRIYYVDIEHTIEAQKETRDVFCLFEMVAADS